MLSYFAPSYLLILSLFFSFILTLSSFSVPVSLSLFLPFCLCLSACVCVCARTHICILSQPRFNSPPKETAWNEPKENDLVNLVAFS